MPWPVHPTGFFGARGDQDTYRIERSLRFNSADSAYLNWTPASAGNRKTWTWSTWFKRSGLGASGFIGGNTNNSALNGFYFQLTTGDILRVGDYATSGFDWLLATTQVFRDVSSWYHVVVSVDTTQATSSNRVKLYINGSQVTSFSTETYPSQNSDLRINTTQDFSIGRTGSYNGEYFSGYLTEINFIDGQALTPSSFGETDPITGRWKAKRYAGTYGTNGFYLNFADNSGTTSTTLGKDSSGNGNNWTPNNFSVTAGAGNDSLLDSPTNNGTSGNYCTLNPLDRSGTTYTPTIDNGNLDFTASGSNAFSPCRGTIFASTGKWYFETTITNNGTFSGQVGISNNYNIYSLNGDNSVSSGIGAAWDGRGFLYFTGSNSAYSPTFTTNDVISCAYDVDAGKIWFRKNNGSWYDSSGGTTGDPATGANSVYNYTAGISIAPFINGVATHTQTLNFGQRPFAYTAPSGFKALCTTNLPTPTIQKPSKYMDVVTYTGTGASNSISSLGFSPDLVWIKNRGGATSHAIYDTTRGTQAQLSSDTTGDEVTSSTGLTAFGSNGFTIGTSSLVNTSGTQYVAWTWDEAPIAGMDIVSYTGSGANRTIAHNLGVAPKMMIVKARVTASTDQGWPVYHTGVASDAETDYLLLNSTAAAADLNTVWNDTAPTSSVFSIGTNALVNTNNDTYIAYLFAEVEGFSKFGSYTGNGSADGPFVWCGFRPRWVMVKRFDLDPSGNSSHWWLWDAVRQTINPSDLALLANTSGGDISPYPIDILSNGFKLRDTNIANNPSGGTHIFAAFAESPFKYARAR